MIIMEFILSLFWPKMPVNVVYMLQQVEYNPHQLVVWLFRMPNLNTVMNRKELVPTRKANALIVVIYLFWVATLFLGIASIIKYFSGYALPAIAILVLSSPLVAISLLLFIVFIARILIVSPQEKRLVRASEELFFKHPGIKIAIAGSYGKTTLKEILCTILSEKFEVAVTEGNMNTPIAHARFISKLNGNEEVVITEYGESSPGDIERFARTTHPEYAVITGLAPNHLDHYKTIEILARDLLSLRDYVATDKLYIPGDSKLLKHFASKVGRQFSIDGVDGWRTFDIKITNESTSFKMRKGKNTIEIVSQLLGRHQIAPLALAASLAHTLGVSLMQIEEGIKNIVPFAHRMQPISIGGAQIIDDTYNGNLEGSIAGIALLSEITADRKIYVTPGLVEQGKENTAVHEKIAQALIETSPDILVLMENTATKIIHEYLKKHNYSGQVKIESDPLRFYKNLEHFVARGDVVMMQNDWTDNYN
jgi:UDP-N-acetylmuramoyl-tripeptide--D-alanyl-D-alanine ligase